MRIQNIVDALTSRWVLYSVLSWAGVLALALAVYAAYTRTTSLQDQEQTFIHEIERLEQKKLQIAKKKTYYKLEDKKLSAILAELASASQSSGVRLGETSVAESEHNGTHTSLPLTIVVHGTYNQIGTFINLMEKNLQFRVREVDLTTKDAKKPGIRCTVKAEYICL